MAQLGIDEKVLLGDTTATVVDKINNFIAQTKTNTDALDTLEEDGIVSEIQINGFNHVKDKKINFKEGNNVTLTPMADGSVTISSTYTDTKNTAGSKENETSKLYLIGAPSQSDNPVTFSNSNVYAEKGVLYSEGKAVALKETVEALESELKAEIGNLSGGMEYVGTVGTGGSMVDTTTLSGSGSSEMSAWALPHITYANGESVKKGNTLKVITAGYYGLGNKFADAKIGDLFVAVLDGGAYWTHVPSGDDGDVYADNTWVTSGQILVTDSDNNTAGKKIKTSGKQIATEITNTNDTSNDYIPTTKAVTDFIDSVQTKALEINTDNFTKTSSTSPVGDAWTSKKKYHGYLPIAVVNFEYVTLFAEVKLEDNKVVVIVDPSVDIINGYVLLTRCGFYSS